MSDILKRDRTGKCEGECSNRVRQGEEERQAKINAESFETPDAYPDVPWAYARNEQPGVYGGHV